MPAGWPDPYGRQVWVGWTLMTEAAVPIPHADWNGTAGVGSLPDYAVGSWGAAR